LINNVNYIYQTTTQAAITRS